MSVKSCEKLEKSTVALTVEVSAADFEAAVEKAYRKQRGSLRVPGFRPGKAPRKMIEKMYGEGVFYEEAVNIALPGAYADAVKEQDLDVVGYPQVELMEVGKEGFSFKATVPVYPEVTLGQYKGIEAPYYLRQVTDEDVDERLRQMADRNSRIIDQDRPVQNGDIANIDFKGYLNGEPFAGGEGDNFDLNVGSGQFVPGFEDQVLGMAPGEERDIDITFPEDYHPELAGKAVVFHVKVNAVKVKEVPELDDEFAKDVSEFDTLEELKADVRSKIAKDCEEDAQNAFEEAVMENVAQGIQAEIPDALVEEQSRRFLENLGMQLRGQGMTLEQYMSATNMDEAAMLEQAREPALRQVRMDLAIAAIVKEENILITDEEIEAEYAKMADQFGMDVENVKKYMEEAVVRERLGRSKAVAAAVDTAVKVDPPKKEEDAPAGEASAEEAPAEEAPAEKPKAKRTRKKKTEEAPAEDAGTPAE